MQNLNQRMYPEDFQGATPGGRIIYISNDEDEAMECKNVSSITDYLSSSEDESEEVTMRDLYVETQMSEPIPIPAAPSTASYKSNEP